MADKPSDAASLHRHPLADKNDLLDGRYHILRLLGEGGMGAVYLAEHVILGRQVAIKFLLADHASKKEMIARFHREARAAATIHHKNIIEVFDVGVSSQGIPFLVMEFLEGESLAALLKRVGVLDLGATCAILEQALLGLQAAHRKGILHRDLKPDNLFLAYVPNEPPTVKLIDFGISKFMEGAPDQSRTQTGSVLGTPAYMSPEQARGLSTVDQRSDLFSVGTILYEMLTGAWPFAGDTFADLLANLLTEPPKPPRQVRPDFPVQAEPLLAKALAKEPAMRFQSTEEMLEALRDLDGFAQRLDRFASLASTIRKRGFAAGDLGQVLTSDSPQDPGALAQEAGTLPAARTRRRVMLGIAGGVVLAGLFAIGSWVISRGDKAAVPSPVPVRPVVEALAPPNPVPAQAVDLPKEPPLPPPEPAKSRGENSPRGEPAIAERSARPAALPSKSKPRPPRTGKTAVTAPAVKVPSEMSEGKPLRSGSRGTKMSESFE